MSIFKLFSLLFALIAGIVIVGYNTFTTEFVTAKLAGVFAIVVFTAALVITIIDLVDYEEV